MKLNFLKLTIRDFKSFIGVHALDLDRPVGVHFMRGVNGAEPRLGSNGSGKTTIWDAFVWCLYGRTPSGLRNPDVKPWRGMEKGTRVSLLLEAGGNRHVVARTTSTNGITLDGEGVGQGEIDKLIGISFLTMTNSMILGQGEGLFFDMTAAGKMQLLSDVKDLDKWDKRSKRASDRVVALTKELGVLQYDKALLSTMIANVNVNLKLITDQEDDWQEKAERKAKERERVTSELTQKIEKLTNELGALDLKYDGAATEAKSCEREVAKLMDERAATSTALYKVRAISKELLAKIERLEDELEGLERSPRCPTCGGGLAKHIIAGMQSSKRKVIEETRGERAKAKTKPLQAALDTTESRLVSAKSYLASFRATADGALSDYKFKQATLADLRVSLKAQEGEELENPYTKQRRMLQKKRKTMLADCELAKADVASCAKELEQVKYWPKGFKDVKLHIIEELLQELELVTCGMLEEVGLVGWRVRYDIERETKSGTTQRALSVMIASPRSKGKLVKWESWSGGEKQRLRVIGSLALASVLLSHAGVTPNMEVLDEPTTHLSDEGIGDLCDYLAERASELNRRIFYADQQSVGGMAFASTITIKRDKAGSRIVSGGSR